MTEYMPIASEMTSPYEILDPQQVPIAGNMMIEASAGTGKTYTITLLVLRLLLGLNVDRTPKALPEILIVTFTNAATAELKERIYSRIVDLKLAFFTLLVGETVNDEALLTLIHNYLAATENELESQKAIEQAINLLIEAEGMIDQASIFTIHAFSQRLLKENALDLGQSFSFELATDLSELHREALYHFWREECYPLDYKFAQMVSSYYGVPVSASGGRFQSASLFTKIEALVRDPSLIMPERFQHCTDLLNLLDTQYTHIIKVKERAIAHFTLEDFTHMIDLVGLKKQSYRADLVKKYHTAFMAWAESDDIELFKDADKFTLPYLESRLMANGDLSRLSPLLTALFEDLALIARFPINAFHYAASKVVKILQMLKRDAGVLGFDDLLTELNKKTITVSDAFLNALHLRYRAVMIDEFQDTDHLQLATFRRLFFNHEQIPFVMIGDPKQSIYGFRGADINAYLSIKSDVDDIYTLNTNYRSGEMQVNAVNQLFGRSADIKPPFIQKDIPFIEITTPKSAEKTALLMGDRAASGMTFLEYIPMEDELTGKRDPSLSQPLFRDRIAVAVANEIAEMLQSGELQTENGTSAIMPEDITVLVRSGHEAEIIQKALRDAGINAVYLSERNSVFDPEGSIVSDLYLFLRSLVFKHERRVLMQSLGSVLYGFSVDEYEAVTSNPDLFEALLTERNALNEVWEKHGVLAMIRAFMVKGDRLARMLTLENGERLASDLFHLGELLQREAFSNGEALLLWLHDKMFGLDGSDGTEIRLESDFKTIQIMTIHKSKGLEFPIVFLPFGLFTTSVKKEGVYVLGENRRYIFSGEATEKEIEYFEAEALAEDIRLLYVALTRAKFHTYVGFTKALNAKSYENNALSYLMGIAEDRENIALNFQGFINCIAVNSLALQRQSRHTLAQSADKRGIDGESIHGTSVYEERRSAAIFERTIAPLWRFTSFSNLSYNAKSSYFTPLLDDELELEEFEGADLEARNQQDLNVQLSLFPKGAITGNFIHELLENYSPSTLLTDHALLETLVTASFAHLIRTDKLPALATELSMWLHDIFYAKLPVSQNLYEILEGDRNIKELEFIFPIESRVNKEKLNALLQSHLAREEGEGLQFEEVSGFLRGFIDLFFEIDGQYYVADYKTNTLGDTKADYHEAQMRHSIKHAHYDLQYLIYSVAVVKFLQNQNPDFDYERDFGGVLYFYLRGMAAGKESGIYAIKPPYAIVAELIALFDKNEEEVCDE